MSELAPIDRLVLYAALALVAMPVLDWLDSKRSGTFRASRRRRESAGSAPAENHRHGRIERRAA
jgi:hypothetical protein